MFDIFIADFIASFIFAFSLRIFIGEHLEADCPKRSYGCRAAAHKSILEIRQLPLRKEEEKSATVVTVAPTDGIMKTHLFNRPSLSLFYRCVPWPITEILNIKVVTFKSLATSFLPLSPAHFLFHIRTNNRRAFGVGTLTERLYMCLGYAGNHYWCAIGTLQ